MINLFHVAVFLFVYGIMSLDSCTTIMALICILAAKELKALNNKIKNSKPWY